MPIPVNADNFVRAETDLMFTRLAADAGGMNQWNHLREPTPLSHQPIVRLNRDTLYSSAIVDLSSPVTLRMPEAGDRYMSVMVINQDHYIPHVFHGAGEHVLTAESCGSGVVLLGVRTLVDPADAADVAEVNRLQDQLELVAGPVAPYVPTDFDQESLTATRQAVLRLADGLPDYTSAFGRRGEVDPVRHLLGAAGGWGGLPEYEANYLNVMPGLPAGSYTMRMADVPVDAFWSVSVYDADGYFVPTAEGYVNLNSITAQKEDDGSVVVRFGTEPDGGPNFLSVGEGWNFLIRMYRPRPEALDGTWQPPAIEPVAG
ncbi:MAG: DUF1214 domain-containing protein [Nocardioides sp.]|uniref:DUF1214 domain-containing protein n=1 Tax=Nocardioides sp. TaxID=35761 RepID=UPI003EFE5BC2